MIEADEAREKKASADRVRPGVTSMTRRRLLSSTGQVAFFASLPMACMPIINAPWADGTLWTDGQGWTD